MSCSRKSFILDGFGIWTSSFVISTFSRVGDIVIVGMSPSSHAAKAKRAARVKLAGSVLALVRMESGKQIRVPLHQLSTSGGLLMLENPLDEGIKVEVMFHVGSCTVRSNAVMLFPMWATQGCIQPFEFSDLADDDRSKLEADLQKYLDQAANHLS
jgi:hypothetical protein